MCASIEKAKRELAWYSKIPLAAGIRETLDWMRLQKFI
jgi:nucleoside-diphosphate-sugar epimerase